MDWKNMNMQSEYERSRNILEPYNFETLLLEIKCNLKEINSDTVRAQAMTTIKAKYEEAIEILNSNLNNITSAAVKHRNEQ